MRFWKSTGTVRPKASTRKSAPSRCSTKLRMERLEPRLVLSTTPLITEFMASNTSTLNDGDGNSSDWIEVHNPTVAAIDLAGWHLTDNANDLSKWTFPSLPQSVLDPGEYLVVFASGQAIETYVDSGGNLHTDFSLGIGGEYLALTDAGAAIVHEFAPSFPKQITDVSYGIRQASTTFLGEGSTVRYLVPSDNSLAINWTAIPFDDSAWSGDETLGVGYETNPTGGTGQLSNVAPNGLASQSSLSHGGVPEHAIDGNFGNFTHTLVERISPLGGKSIWAACRFSNRSWYITVITAASRVCATLPSKFSTPASPLFGPQVF